MKEIMFKFYKLLLLVLVSCSTYLPGMEQTIPDIVRQAPILPGASIRQTGIIETVVRDALCGGFIKPSIAGAIMAVALTNDGPCRRYYSEGDVTLRCFFQGVIGFYSIAFVLLLKCGGYVFEVANNHPTKPAIFCREGCRVLCGATVMWAMLYSDYLFEKFVLQ